MVNHIKSAVKYTDSPSAVSVPWLETVVYLLFWELEILHSIEREGLTELGTRIVNKAMSGFLSNRWDLFGTSEISLVKPRSNIFPRE